MTEQNVSSRFSSLFLVFLAILSFALGTWFFYRELQKPKIYGELSIIEAKPEGEDLSIFSQTILVKFDHPLVSMAELQSKKVEEILPVSIEPKINGNWEWLSPRSVIFRPAQNLDPATRYQVKVLMASRPFVSPDGYTFNKDFSFGFSTVRPKAYPFLDDQLGPNKPIEFVFNLSMNTEEVESLIEILDQKTGKKIDWPLVFQWSDQNHRLRVLFEEQPPFGSDFQIFLPEGLHAAKGNLTTNDSVLGFYRTPHFKLELERVFSGSREFDFLSSSTLYEIEAGEPICFIFSEPILANSFESAFHFVKEIDPKTETQPAKLSANEQPYFYYELFSEGSFQNESGNFESQNGVSQACVKFLNRNQQIYRFWIDPEKIRGNYGAQLHLRESSFYRVKTTKGLPKLYSKITKNLLSVKGVKKLPFMGSNLKEARAYLRKTTFYDASFISSNKAGYTEPYMYNPGDIHYEYSGNFKISPSENLAFFEIDLKQMSPMKQLQEQPAQSLPEGIYELLVEGVPEDASDSEYVLALNQIIEISSVGLSMKRFENNLMVWATEIETGEPIRDLPIRLIDGTKREDQKFLEEKTDLNGVAIFREPEFEEDTEEDTPEELKPLSFGSNLCVVVDQGLRKGYACQEEHGIRDFNFLGTFASFAWIQTDRPIYRPGQTVFFSAFLRQVKDADYFAWNTEDKVSVKMIDAAGQEIYSAEDVSPEEGGIVQGGVLLKDSDEIPRGEYSIEIETSDQQRFRRTFHVASYRKPSFKVDLTSASLEVSSNQKIEFMLQGTYFFGAPLASAKASWSILTEPYLFKPEGFEGFSFIDPDLLIRKQEEGEESYDFDASSELVAYSDHVSEDSSFEENPKKADQEPGSVSFFQDPNQKQIKAVPVILDEEGKLPIVYAPNLLKYPVSQRLTVEASVVDSSNQEVSAAEQIVVHKADFYFGLKPERWVLEAGNEASVRLVSVSKDGKPVADKPYKIDVFQRNYRYASRYTADGWIDERIPEDSLLKSFSGRTDRDGNAILRYKIPETGGIFRFVATGVDSYENPVHSATQIQAWCDRSCDVSWDVHTPDQIVLVPDKDSYKVGETAKVLIKSIVPPTKALMTIERGGLIDYRIVEMPAGLTHLEIPITEGMAPNVYLSLVAHVGRHENQPPLLLHGNVELAIEPENKRLQIVLTPDHPASTNPVSDPIYRPGEEVTFKVETKDAFGKAIPAHLIVSVADESVLRLLGYELPDLVKKFFYKRNQGVGLASSLVHLKAGDGEASAFGIGKTRRVFKDTAHFIGHLKTDQNGQATFTFKLPDDLTTWVVDAFAISDSKTIEEFEAELKDDLISHAESRPNPESRPSAALFKSRLNLGDWTFVGSTRSKIMTTLPVVLRASLPRFAAWEDQVEGKILLNNRNPKPVSLKLFMKVSGDATLKDPQKIGEIDVVIPAQSEKSVPVALEILEPKQGLFRFFAEAKDQDGKTLDSFEVEVPVKDRFVLDTITQVGVLQKNHREEILIPTNVVQEKGGLEITLRASSLTAMAGGIRTMVDYPYGCGEQRSSRLLVLLKLKNLAEGLDEAAFDQIIQINGGALKEGASYAEKRAKLDLFIQTGVNELLQKFWNSADGGMRYWPEDSNSNRFVSAQIFWALTSAKNQHFTVDESRYKALKNYLLQFVREKDSSVPFALWALSFTDAPLSFDFLDQNSNLMMLQTTDVAYLLMATHNKGVSHYTDKLLARLETLENNSKSSTRFVSDYQNSPEKIEALIGMALLQEKPDDLRLRKIVESFFNKKKKMPDYPSTQDNLYRIAFVENFLSTEKDGLNLEATVRQGSKTLLSVGFSPQNQNASPMVKIPMQDLLKMGNQIALDFEPKGQGKLYYEIKFQTYPKTPVPPREQSITVHRQYYALNDRFETTPLSQFKVGVNYRAHLTVIVETGIDYFVIQDLLPAGFEAIDATLETSSKAALLDTADLDSESDDTFIYDDDSTGLSSFDTNFAFTHQEVWDDRIFWSGEYLPAGVYHIRYPVRAIAEGSYLMPGADVFKFYDPESFGRSAAATIEISE